MKTWIIKGFFILSSLSLALIVLQYLSKNPLPSQPTEQTLDKTSYEKFKTDEEFKEYFEKSQIQTGTSNFALKSTGAITDSVAISAPSAMTGQEVAQADRYSQTNVQVVGIDEPDIVKTDGKEIYYSSQMLFTQPLIQTDVIPPDDNVRISEGISRTEYEEMIAPRPRKTGGTLSISAFPPQNLKKDSEIDKTGSLLLVKNTLLIFESNAITGYDIKNPATPKKEWQIDLKNNVQIIGTRLYDNKVYLIAKKYLVSDRVCPLEFFEGSPLSVKCTDIYHPLEDYQADSVYTAVKIDAQSGIIEKVHSFVASQNSTAIYMSPKNLYATYYFQKDYVSLFSEFISEEKSLFPTNIYEKIKKLDTYDISPYSKQTELYSILEKYFASLDEDERLKFENNMNNSLTRFMKKNFRELGQTGIVKIGLENLEISAQGSVPGKTLNQFSLDEYEDHLRIATTVGENNFWGFGISSSRQESANDVYILDNNLKITGSITDLGLTERIYSARFIENKGYLVTFRQTDPFYVLDLSNPRSPKKAGELKIPGFSSYLHPLDKNIILGVGMESGKVKLSLFDVSNPSNPNELDKYNLDDYWTEVSNNHHAFLQDKDHEIFFLPGSKGAYIFSYKNNKLELVKTLANHQTKRALYINDYLYIITDKDIVVFLENTWEKINQIPLN